MESGPRPASSVYSDQFELDELLHHLSEQTQVQRAFLVEALEKENKLLSFELIVERQVWESLYHCMVEIVEIADQLKVLQRDAERRILIRKQRWLANCTAI